MTTATLHSIRPDDLLAKPDVPDPLKTPPGSIVECGGDPVFFDFGDGYPDEADGDRLRYALFSGGDDSLASTHFIMKNDLADVVLHLATNTGLAENAEYVVETCREFDWPLRVEPSPMSLAEMAMKYGFPGSAYHNVAYSYLKERQLFAIAKEYDGKPRFKTGVLKDESDRRAKTIADEEVQEHRSWYWHAPIREWLESFVDDYREAFDLPKNPVAAKIHRSGDCYCGAYAHRDELLVDLFAKGYDRHGNWLLAVEAAVQAYRGTLEIFRDRYPTKFGLANQFRDRFRPKPMRAQVLRYLHPFEWADVASLDLESKVSRAREEEVNYWGHGEMTNDELDVLIEQNRVSQMSLCNFCDGGEGWD